MFEDLLVVRGIHESRNHERLRPIQRPDGEIIAERGPVDGVSTILPSSRALRT
jgi:hypothetical protein